MMPASYILMWRARFFEAFSFAEMREILQLPPGHFIAKPLAVAMENRGEVYEPSASTVREAVSAQQAHKPSFKMANEMFACLEAKDNRIGSGEPR